MTIVRWHDPKGESLAAVGLDGGRTTKGAAFVSG